MLNPTGPNAQRRRDRRALPCESKEIPGPLVVCGTWLQTHAVRLASMPESTPNESLGPKVKVGAECASKLSVPALRWLKFRRVCAGGWMTFAPWDGFRSLRSPDTPPASVVFCSRQVWSSSWTLRWQCCHTLPLVQWRLAAAGAACVVHRGALNRQFGS